MTPDQEHVAGFEAERFYDEGWNAYIDGRAYDHSKSLDWCDGWRDAKMHGATELDRQ